MQDEYITINKTKLLTKIEELKKSLAKSEAHNDKIRAAIEHYEIKMLEWCLSQSTTLIPETEEDKGHKCSDSPSGYCEYDWEESNETCIYCGEPEERK